MAMYIIRRNSEWTRHSPIFDVESLFWVLISVPLYQAYIEGTLGQYDAELYKNLCPDSASSFRFEVPKKISLLLEISREFYGIESCLTPYLPLLVQLQLLVDKYDRKAAKTKGIFSPVEEDVAVDEYIKEVEDFLCGRGEVQTYHHQAVQTQIRGFRRCQSAATPQFPASDDSDAVTLPKAQLPNPFNPKAPLPRYETLQESLDIGHTLLDEADVHKLINAFLGALYGEHSIVVRMSVSLTVHSQDITISTILATFIVT